MREMFYFVAFGFLFAFLIPLLIGTIIQDDGQDAWRSQKDVVSDANKLLPTAAETANDCRVKGYSYLLSADGHAYVQQENVPYIAALIDDQVVILQFDGNSNPVLVDPQDHVPADVKSDLSSYLSTCLKSDNTPTKTAVLLGEKK